MSHFAFSLFQLFGSFFKLLFFFFELLLALCYLFVVDFE